MFLLRIKFITVLITVLKVILQKKNLMETFYVEIKVSINYKV